MSNPTLAKRTRASDSNQPPPIPLSEAQMCALLAASYPLPPARAGWLHAVRLIRLILSVSSSNGVRNKNQPKMTSDGVQATIIPSRNA
jgi:hypothetical protein